MIKPENPPKLEDYGFKPNEYELLNKSLDNQRIIPSIVVVLLGIGFWFVLFIYDGLLSIVVIPLGLFIFYLLKKSSSKYNGPQLEKFKQFLKDEENYNEKLIEYQYWVNKQKEDFWFNLTGHEFESEVNNLFQKKGLNTKLTKGSGDKGIDIVILEDDGGTIVQCKNHKNPISPSTVRELYGVMTSENSNKGILINTGGFTKGVYEFVEGKPIELWDINKIIQMNESLN